MCPSAGLSRRMSPWVNTRLVASLVLVLALLGAPQVATLAATCTGTKPVAGPCEIVTCSWGEWAIGYKAAGTACSDSNSCTYGDVCSSFGTCVGTAISCTPRGPCETSTCNGTSACVVTIRSAGTACPYSNSGNPAEAPSPCEATCDGASPWCQP